MENTLSDVIFEPSEADFEFVDALVDALADDPFVGVEHFDDLDAWRRAEGLPTFAEAHGGLGVERFVNFC